MMVLFVGRVLRLRRNTHWHKDVNFDSLHVPCWLRGISGKVEFYVPYWATGSSTRAGTGGGTDVQLIGSSVADFQVLT